MEDQMIIDLFWRRSEDAVAEVQSRYGGMCMSVAGNILKDPEDIRECLNDTYLALWNRIPPEKPDPLSAYICRIARNIALKRRRNDRAQKRCSEFDLSLDELAACLAGPSLDAQLDARELGRAIDAFLDTVTRENRILFLRRYWFGDSIQAIAASMGIRENSVSVRLYRTRNQLKTYLIQEGYYEG